MLSIIWFQALTIKVSKAAAFAVTHAAKRSIKQCALYVNNALRAQGIRSSGNGVDVASNLLKSGQGFHQVAYSKDYVPQIGDVMSMKSNSRSGHNYGHVAIYTEDGWVFMILNRARSTATLERQARNIGKKSKAAESFLLSRVEAVVAVQRGQPLPLQVKKIG